MQAENIVSCRDMEWIPFEPRCAPIDEFLTKTNPSVLSTLGGEGRQCQNVYKNRKIEKLYNLIISLLLSSNQEIVNLHVYG